MSQKKPPRALQVRNSAAEFLIFSYQTGGDGIEVRVENGTIWLSQKQMAALFDTTLENVITHLKNIMKDGELRADSVTNDFLVTAADAIAPTASSFPRKRESNSSTLPRGNDGK